MAIRYNGLVMSSKKTFLILDGNALLHRAWHALPQTMTTSDGTVVNAVYGFTSVVEKMRADVKPDFMAVAWDLPGETFRHKEFKAYKATRLKKEQELYDQIPMIQELMRVYGIPSLTAKGFEADDVIGTLAKRNKKTTGLETLIVTGDRDVLQLVDDRTKALFFVKGMSETKLYDEDAVRERYNLEPNQLIDLKALMGDASDNLPGVAGIGEKSALELIKEFGSVEGVFKSLKQNPEAIKQAWRNKLQGQKDVALQMKKLVAIVKNVPLTDFTLAGAATQKPDFAKLVEQFRRLEFRTFIKKYEQKAQGSLFDGGGKKAVLEKVFVPQLINGTTIGYDLKSEMHRSGKRINGPLFDLAIAAYLLNSSGRQFELPAIAEQWLKKSTCDEEDIIALYHKLSAELKKTGLIKIMQEIEMPLLPILFEMETAGVKLDSGFLKKLSAKMHHELGTLTKNIYKLAGREFNVNSPSQLAEVLFVDLKLSSKNIKKTKTGLSTGIDELEKLEELHPIVKLMMQYRELAKLISTYVDALPQLVAKDGRLHTTFNQTIAATGRLSSTNPNLQNIPVRTEAGREIRKAFVAEPHHLLLSADYSQIELRIAAVIAHDETFIKAFKEGADIHTRTAAEVWGVKESEVTKEERYAAKAINFGILYGMGARSLAKSTNLSQNEAREFLDKYFEIHPAIQEYIERTKRQAHKDGFVETLFGRRRYLPEIHSGVQMLIAQAERMAINMPMQGTQADIIKMAMIKIAEAKLEARLLLQVHDELVFEVSETQAKKIGEEIRRIMNSVVKLDVPLVVDVAIGKNWGEL